MMGVRIALLLLCVLSTEYSVLGTASAADYTQRTWHTKLVTLHNAARAEAKASPLSANAKLAAAAQAHAEHMARTGEFAHEGIGNGDPSTRIAAAGYTGKRYGENIAWGATSAEKAYEIWMKSDPHREQLLTPEYTEVGFGASKAADGKVYWVACFGAP
jgi:uncharacterized protein YkwD